MSDSAPVQAVKRRVVVWYLMTTLIPALALAGAGWALIREDRAQQVETRRVGREQAAELATAALTRLLSQLDDQVSRFAVEPGASASLDNEIVFARFSRAQITDRAGLRLPYYPGATWARPDLPALVARADVLEFGGHDLAGAVRLLDPVTSAADETLRGEALLRVARLNWKEGRTSAALEAFDRLAALDTAIVDGQPAGVLGMQGRAVVLAAAGRHDELETVAATLLDHLDSGRWILGRIQYEYAREKVHGWIGAGAGTDSSAPGHSGADRAALCEAAARVWDEWQQNADAPAGSGKRTLWIDGHSVLALTRRSSDRLTIALAGSHYLDEHWRRAADLANLPDAVGLALTDGDGHLVAGTLAAPPALQALRTTSETGLPWTLHAYTVSARSTALTRPAQFMLAALAVMLCVVLAGGHLIVRTLTRELRVSRLQSEFVSAVSHEFRTPLTTVRHLSQLLARGRVTTDLRRTEFYGILVRESDRLQRLVENLLDFARVESGEVAYRFEAIAPGPFVRDVVRDFCGEQAQTASRIQIAEPVETLPEIRADREMLARVFWNLLDNAVKYSSPEAIDIRVGVTTSAGRVVVRVRDRGMGIPADEQPRIFDKFVRGDSARAASIRGTGIGLALSREIVRAHGGDITVASEAGRGSTFEVWLPVIAGASDPELNRWRRAS